MAIDASMTALNVMDRSIMWDEDAVMDLFYFLRLSARLSSCHIVSTSPLPMELDSNESLQALAELQSPFHSYNGLTTLQSLVRASLIFAEHMGRGVIHSDDVLDAARVLRLSDMPPRWGVPFVWTGAASTLGIGVESLVVNACFQTLQMGRADVVPIIVVREGGCGKLRSLVAVTLVVVKVNDISSGRARGWGI